MNENVTQLRPPFCDEYYEAFEDRSKRSHRLHSANNNFSEAYAILDILDRASLADCETEMEVSDAMVLVCMARKRIKAGQRALKKYDKKQTEWEIAPLRKPSDEGTLPEKLAEGPPAKQGDAS